jgi:predicted RNase H-like nuclease (RuvC/YqgF family)
MTEALAAIADAQDLPAGGQQQPNATEVTPAENTDAGSDVEEVEDEEGDGEDGDKQPVEPELVDVEINGKTYKLPAELKDRVWLDADYTTKSQANAELKKSLDAKQAEIDQAYQTSQDVIEARAIAHNIDTQLKQYEGVNWPQLEQEDPMAAMSHWRQFQQLKEQRGQVAQYLDKTQAEMSEQLAQETDKRLRETRAFAEKEIPGWTPDVDVKIVSFAEKDLGFTREQLRNSLSPAVYKTLHLAMIGAEAIKRTTTPPKQQQQAPQPLTKLTARANPPNAGLDDRLPQDEWLKRRNAQLAKKG